MTDLSDFKRRVYEPEVASLKAALNRATKTREIAITAAFNERGRREDLEAVLARIEESAKSCQMTPPNLGHVRTLVNIATWAREALASLAAA